MQEKPVAPAKISSEADYLRARILPEAMTVAVFIAIVQCILFFGHLFLYRTWTFSLPAPQPLWLRLTVVLLSVSFVAASVLAFRYTNSAVRALYKASAVWLGL